MLTLCYSLNEALREHAFCILIGNYQFLKCFISRMQYSETELSADIHSQKNCGNLRYYSFSGWFLPFFVGVVAPTALPAGQNS